MELGFRSVSILFSFFYLSTYFILTILMPVWLGWRCMY